MSTFAPPNAPAGYFNIEQILLDTGGAQNDGYSIYGAALEEAAKRVKFTPTDPYIVPVKNIHLGKGWGWAAYDETTPYTGELVNFRNKALIKEAYTYGKTTALSDFNKIQSQLDPEGVFKGGAMLRWLDPNITTSDYDPQSLNGFNCSTYPPVFRNQECISDCCNNHNTCIESGLLLHVPCSLDCQCASTYCFKGKCAVRTPSRKAVSKPSRKPKSTRRPHPRHEDDDDQKDDSKFPKKDEDDTK